MYDDSCLWVRTSGLGLAKVRLPEKFAVNLVRLRAVKGISALGRGYGVNEITLTLVLVLLLVASSVAVVSSSYQQRKALSRHEVLIKKQDRLQSEWVQLLLEQSAWSAPGKIESVAVNKLKMRLPKSDELSVLR